jgi:hypothetical protein
MERALDLNGIELKQRVQGSNSVLHRRSSTTPTVGGRGAVGRGWRRREAVLGFGFGVSGLGILHGHRT